jgi:hypothetical protein
MHPLKDKQENSSKILTVSFAASTAPNFNGDHDIQAGAAMTNLSWISRGLDPAWPGNSDAYSFDFDVRKRRLLHDPQLLQPDQLE